MSVELKTKGFKASIEYISAQLDALNEVSQIALESFANAVISEARSNLQNNTNVNTGELLSSIKILDQGKDFIIFGTHNEYAFYIEFGRGPLPKVPGRTYHWKDKHTGEDVFAKSAKAFNASPFLEPAVITKTQTVANVFIERIKLIPIPTVEVDQ